jgi:cell wall-associated NlpC family hydrolase
MTVDEQRARVVAEAKSWLRTPYHHRGRIKGAGVDCGMLLIEVFAAAGVIEDFDPGYYPHDWHLHRSEERYLGWVERHAHRVDVPLPGDVLLFKFGRCISHGAIVVEWPTVIHAYLRQGCRLARADQAPLDGRLDSVWSVWY